MESHCLLTGALPLERLPLVDTVSFDQSATQDRIHRASIFDDSEDLLYRVVLRIRWFVIVNVNEWKHAGQCMHDSHRADVHGQALSMIAQ